MFYSPLEMKKLIKSLNLIDNSIIDLNVYRNSGLLRTIFIFKKNKRQFKPDLKYSCENFNELVHLQKIFV